MNRSKGISIVILVVITGLYSCSKKGDTGPAGATGTANVMYSTWNPLKMTFNSSDSAYEQIIVADSITQAVLDSGLVLSYIKYNNSAGQQQVESAGTYMEEVFALKAIQLYSYSYDYTGVSFRYIIVHGGTSLTGGRVANTPGLIQGYTRDEWKTMPYTKVVSLLGTP